MQRLQPADLRIDALCVALRGVVAQRGFIDRRLLGLQREQTDKQRRLVDLGIVAPLQRVAGGRNARGRVRLREREARRRADNEREQECAKTQAHFKPLSRIAASTSMCSVAEKYCSNTGVRSAAGKGSPLTMQRASAAIAR